MVAALAAFKALVEAGVELPRTAHLLVTIAEEIGQGASHGLDRDVAEMVSIDNGVVAPGQQSREDTVTVAMGDMTGPFDPHLSRRLAGLVAGVARLLTIYLQTELVFGAWDEAPGPLQDFPSGQQPADEHDPTAR